MEITAACLSRLDAPFEVTTLDLADPQSAEVLVRVVASGICASDAHTRSGRIPSPLPCVLGHEGAGVVEAVGEGVAHVAPGDHVALSWMPSCGQCRHCLNGRPVLCTAATPYTLAGTLLDGTTRLSRNGDKVHHYSFLSTFASHAVVPAASAIRIDPDVSLAAAAGSGRLRRRDLRCRRRRSQRRHGRTQRGCATGRVRGPGGVQARRGDVLRCHHDARPERPHRRPGPRARASGEGRDRQPLRGLPAGRRHAADPGPLQGPHAAAGADDLRTCELHEINAAFDHMAAGALNRGVLVLDPDLAL